MGSWTLPFLHQPPKGYRYGIDSFLLVRFMHLTTSDHVCDLGAGVGIVGLLALKRREVRHVTLVEIQEEFAGLARKNALEMGFGERTEVLLGNWKDAAEILKGRRYDVVVSNPPYRKKETGRIPPLKSKAIAKHEILGTMEELIEAGRSLLKPSGRFYLMYPPLRLEECLVGLSKARLKVQRLCFIHSYPQDPAKLFMVEAVKSEPRELHVEAPVVIYRDPEHYTKEVEEWVGRKRKL